MNRLFKMIVACSLSLSILSAQAAGSFTACAPPSIRVAFSNGILTTPEIGLAEAIAVSNRAAVLSNKVRPGDKDMKYFYHDHNGLGDFAETFLQKEKETEYASSNFITKSVSFFSIIAGVVDGSAFATALITVLQKSLTPAMLAESKSRIDLAVAKDVAFAKGMLQQGDSVLLVAHSQGNLYANEVVRQLYAALPTSLVDARLVLMGAGVASHGLVGRGGIASDTNYVTNTLDLVIGGVRLAAVVLGQPQPSPANSTGFATTLKGSDFIVQHSFMGVYFNEALDPGKMLVKTMTDVVLQLGNSMSTAIQPGDVAFTFKTTLTYPVSLAELFADGPTVDVPQAGQYAGSFRSRVVSKSDKSLSFETEVLCSLVNTAPTSEAALAVGLLFPVEAGTPNVSDMQLQTPDGSTTWAYPASAGLFTPATVNGDKMLALAINTANIKNLGQGRGVNVRNPNAAP